MKRKRGIQDDEDEEYTERVQKRRNVLEVHKNSPYLYTVKRQFLDFDGVKFCSVSLSTSNIYACMVCGKYFQGGRHQSYAHAHSLEAGHRVFIDISTGRVVCLPDGYEITDPSLGDIRSVLKPRFSIDEISEIDKKNSWSRAVDGSYYLPGMVGLCAYDAVNVTIQSLMRVTPLRNYFLRPENYMHSKSLLVHRFGELTRKIWHAKNFRRQVCPHEFLQAVTEKQFHVGADTHPVDFMSWLLNTLHTDLKKGKTKSTIIHDCFKGMLEYTENEHILMWVSVEETDSMPFIMLGLDLPAAPLFRDAQVPLFHIMKKFDGESVTEVVRPRIVGRKYRVTTLPQYLILHMRRFTKNKFFVEKNPTLVNFPLKNLELRDYIPLPTPPQEEEKKLPSNYNLIACIIHEGKPGEGSYKVNIQRKSDGLWYEMETDLSVHEIDPLIVAQSETHVLIYEQELDDVVVA